MAPTTLGVVKCTISCHCARFGLVGIVRLRSNLMRIFQSKQHLALGSDPMLGVEWRLVSRDVASYFVCYGRRLLRGTDAMFTA